MPRPKMTARHGRVPRRPEGNKAQKNPLKKRMRDLRRQLERKDDLPADVRIHHERELASCQYELEQAEKHSQRSRIIKKYHMVRFFERKNATKLLKRACKQLRETDDGAAREKFQQEAHQFEVDLNYAQYFPLHLPYISLYAGTKDKDGKVDPARVDRTTTMWKVVEQAMETDKLDDLRNGRLEGYRDHDEPSLPAQPKPQSFNKDGHEQRGAAAAPNDAKGADDEDEDADDGQGFFE